MNFTDLKLIAPLIKALKKKRFYEPTPVQQKAIPHIMKRKHMLVTAEAGMGKTASYILPIVQMIYKIDSRLTKPPMRAIMIAPNVDMARQMDRNLASYCKFTNVTHNALWNKGKSDKFFEAHRNILVATPEVLAEILEKNSINTKELKIVVLDELEQMIPKQQALVESLLAKLPADIQRLFFISTPNEDCNKWADGQLQNAEKVTVTAEELAEFKRTAYERKAQRALSSKKSDKTKSSKAPTPISEDGTLDKKTATKLKHIFRNRSEDLPKTLQKKMRWPLG